MLRELDDDKQSNFTRTKKGKIPLSSVIDSDDSDLKNTSSEFDSIRLAESSKITSLKFPH